MIHFFNARHAANLPVSKNGSDAPFLAVALRATGRCNRLQPYCFELVMLPKTPECHFSETNTSVYGYPLGVNTP